MADEYTDLEHSQTEQGFLQNDTVHGFMWKELYVTVKDRQTKKMKDLIANIDGCVERGELLALMGPSGCGKTTLLNVLARRSATSRAKVSGVMFVDGAKLGDASFKRISSYVEQEDALIGSLTVEETLKFAARLALPGSVTRADRAHRVRMLLEAFGIRGQAKTLVGTPIRKGISGGQKRRASVASQLITSPKILFLDEPTSGLDSKASFEVINYLKKLAKRNNIIVIASIHQPSTTTFELFDKLLLLSSGKTCYFGRTAEVGAYFDHMGFPMPQHTNPAEFLLDIVSADFSADGEESKARLEKIQQSWVQSDEAEAVNAELMQMIKEQEASHKKLSMEDVATAGPGIHWIFLALLHRSFIKSNRDIVAYGVRIIMYLGLAIMMGTVWLRLQSSQEYIQPYINALFFSSAFMSFMAVAYVPAYLEDRATFVKERANGLYGATPFIASNFIIGLPYLFFITLLFSIVAYWLSNFRNSGSAFFIFVSWLFLDLLAAESLVVFVSSIFPDFVIALALVAFANGLWMSVGGFLVSQTILNPFWKYVFHYIDYQAYVFQGMMANQFSSAVYSCGPSCQCIYQTSLAPQCQISGAGVLKQYGYAEGRQGKWAGILVGIIAVYRLFGWIALRLRKT